MDKALPYLIKGGKFVLKAVIMAAIATAAGKASSYVDEKL